MAQAFFGGIHLHDMKAATKEKAIEQLTPPTQVIIHLSQHMGTPCRPLVRAGDHVKVGQRIGEPTEVASVPVHASVSGTVKAVEPRPCPQGGNSLAVVIENDFQDTISEEITPPENPETLTAQETLECIWNAGVVGMGGAGFPTHVKIAGAIGEVDTVIVNGAECEPYVTSDHRVMLEQAEAVVGGCAFLARLFGVDEVIIAEEMNKKNGIDALKKAVLRKRAPVVVEPLRCRYPQGSEKQLCQTITGRQVPPGGLPVDVGCVVFNVSTVCAIYRALTSGMPVVRRVVTVSGSGVLEPKNLECPVGTPIADLFDACGGLREKTHKLIMGGPMTGMAQYTAEVPVQKGTNAVLAFSGREDKRVKEPQCIRCGKCAEVCPMHLQPLFLYQYASRNMLEEMEQDNLMDCVECGACAYICPGRMHLVQMFRAGKQRLREKWAAESAAGKAAAEETGRDDGE